MPDFEVVSPFQPSGDQPQAMVALANGVRRGDRYQTLQGITGSGKTATIAWTDRAGAATHAHHRAQQVAGRPAVLRAAGALPQEPGRVLRLLLRLLPARGLPPDHRHLHREGLVDQRRDRPAPARHHLVAADAAGRDRRGVGVVHLRPRLARRVPGPHPGAGDGGADRPAGHPAPARRPAVRAQRRRTSCAGPSGPAATPSRSTPPTRSRRCGSSCSATRSSGSCPSTS